MIVDNTQIIWVIVKIIDSELPNETFCSIGNFVDIRNVKSGYFLDMSTLVYIECFVTYGTSEI